MTSFVQNDLVTSAIFNGSHVGGAWTNVKSSSNRGNNRGHKDTDSRTGPAQGGSKSVPNGSFGSDNSKDLSNEAERKLKKSRTKKVMRPDIILSELRDAMVLLDEDTLRKKNQDDLMSIQPEQRCMSYLLAQNNNSVMLSINALKKTNSFKGFINKSIDLLKRDKQHKIRKKKAELIGTEVNCNNLLKRLMEGNEVSKQQLKIVSIIGVGGLGKTTIAKVVYEKLKVHFDCGAFISVSFNPNIAKIFKNILHQFGKTNTDSNNEDQLINELKEFLRNKRYFVVIDDIWDLSVWDKIKCALAENNCGSRLITTTRNRNVAQHVGGVYQLKPLSVIDSGKLFYQRIFGAEQKRPPIELAEISESILKRCGRIPLAIITIASVLKSKLGDENTHKYWSKVNQSLGIELECSAMKNMRKILSVSYNELPLHLKNCLLYLSIFPEDHVIEREQLVWRWIAEDLIPEVHGRTSEQVGNEVFNELINRSLIQPTDIQYDGTALGCRVHDMILELIISISTKDNFVTIVDHQERKFELRKIHRLSYKVTYAEKAVRKMGRDELSQVQSFSVLGHVREIPRLRDFRALRLRVLDLGSCRFIENHHIKNLGRLTELKYLDLSQTSITELPSQIGNLKYLETLDLRCRIEKLPSTIAALKNLQRLFVDSSVRLPDEIGCMQGLQMLLCASMSCNYIRFVEELGKLNLMGALQITFGKPADMADEVSTYTTCFVSSLNKMGNLQCLKIDCEEGSLLDSLIEVRLVFPCLRMLRIAYISRLPKWIGWVQSLVQLEVKVVVVQVEDLDMLEGIVGLLYLELEVKDASNKIINIGNRGFQNLKEFHFICWNDGMGLVFAESAMPELDTLHLCFQTCKTMCMYGGVDDSGIHHLTSLKNLFVDISCSGSNNMEVEAVEASISRAADKHRTQLILEIQRCSESDTMDEKVHKDNKGITKNSMRRRRITRATVGIAFRVRAARSEWSRTLKKRLATPSAKTPE
uniref:Uncharacterized protein n=1 Tax=Avena sativa TaxID=4498 RepID=A0ACD5ZAG8_AVESA